MKRTVSFIVLLALILSAGFFSVDIAALLSRDSDSMTAQPRNDSGIYSEAAYNISFGFDPMSLVRSENAMTASNESRSYAVVSAAIMKNISGTYSDWQFDDKTAMQLIDSTKYSERGFVYAERFAYSSHKKTEQLLDFIVRVPDMRIVYVRFYTDAETEADEAAAKKAIHSLTLMSEKTYTSDQLIYWQDQMYEILGSSSESRMISNSGNFAEVDHALSAACSAASGINLRPGSGSLGEFWLRAWSLSWVYFYRDYIMEYNFAVNYIINSLYEYSMSDSKCAVYKGRIYQSIDFGPNRLYVIYNIAEGRPEGFYAKPTI